MIILHYAPDNASLIVRLALEETGLHYETRLVDRAAREQDGAAYRRLNPAGLIPALETPQGPIFETGAILLWLTETHGTLAPAPGSADRGAFLKWLFFTSNTLHAEMRMLFYPDRYAPTHASIPAFSERTRERIGAHLSILDTMASARPVWCTAETPSILVFYLCALLRWLALYPVTTAGWFDLTAYPALRTLAAGTETHPSARRAAAAEGLGPTIFTQPRYATPPEGSAT